VTVDTPKQLTIEAAQAEKPVETTRDHLGEVNAVIAKALHDAWLVIHINRMDENHHARSISAYNRTAEAKHLLDEVWAELDLEGRIFDPPAQPV